MKIEKEVRNKKRAKAVISEGNRKTNRQHRKEVGSKRRRTESRRKVQNTDTESDSFCLLRGQQRKVSKTEEAVIGTHL